MASMTNYLENKIVDWLFRSGTYTPPTNFYVALFTAAPSDAGGGTEVTGGSYARVAIAAGASTWKSTQDDTTSTSSGTGGTTKNVAVVTFPTATADWGTATHAALFDASTSGNMLWQGALTASQSITSGVTYSIPAGSLTVQIDN